MTTSDRPRGSRRLDPLETMSDEIYEEYRRLPKRVRRCYLKFREERTNRRGAHRDQLEAFVAGYFAKPNRRRSATDPQAA